MMTNALWPLFRLLKKEPVSYTLNPRAFAEAHRRYQRQVLGGRHVAQLPLFGEDSAGRLVSQRGKFHKAVDTRGGYLHDFPQLTELGRVELSVRYSRVFFEVG